MPQAINGTVMSIYHGRFPGIDEDSDDGNDYLIVKVPRQTDVRYPACNVDVELKEIER